MNPDDPPPPLVLSALLHDVSNWLSLPDAPPPPPALLSASSTAASSFISAGRQASGFLNLLPGGGGSRAATPPVENLKAAGAPDESAKPLKKVKTRSAEAYGRS
jgi:hypothetical protein